MKVALLQFCAGTNKAANLLKALTMSQEALERGAEFILLPEVFNFRGAGSDKGLVGKAAEKIPGPSTDAFVPLAKKYNVSFLLGSILEKAPHSHVYNTSVFIGPRGAIDAQYRKIHLFDARIDDKTVIEADCVRAGRRPAMAKVGVFRIGLSICYDLRFPGLYQNYARRGVEILTVPSCFNRKTGQAHWEVLLRARAIENLCYVLAPNQVGPARGFRQAYGHSMVISPWGEVMARGSARAQEIIFAEIDLAQVKKARSILPGIAL